MTEKKRAMTEKKRSESKPPGRASADRKSAPRASQTAKGAAKTAAAPTQRKAAPKPRVVPGVSKAAASPKSTAKKLEVPRERPLSVLMVVPEFRPYVKTSGLADMAAALPQALARLGHRVTLVLPKYRGTDVSLAQSQPVIVSLGDRSQEVTFHTYQSSGGVTTVFVDVPDLFDRTGLPNSEEISDADNAWRFALFNRAALEYARLQGERPSVIHAHDWQAGLVPVFQKMHLSNDPVVGGVPMVFTIHNLASQGVFPASTLPSIGLGWEALDVQALEFWGQISYLKGGINFSDRVTTAVTTDVREVLNPERGHGLDGVLARRADALTGIQPVSEAHSWDASALEYVKVYRGAEKRAGA
jgi:starch synthase